MRQSFNPERRQISPIMADEDHHGPESEDVSASYGGINGNSYFHYNGGGYAGRGMIEMGVANNVDKHDQFVPNFMGRNTWGNCSRPVPIHNPQPTPGHYLRLSYYGEEIDKEYLPEATMPSVRTPFLRVERSFDTENEQQNAEGGFHVTQNQQGKNIQYFPSSTQETVASGGAFGSTRTAQSFKKNEDVRSHDGYQMNNYRQQKNMQRQHFQHNNGENQFRCPHDVRTNSFPSLNITRDNNDNFESCDTNESVKRFHAAASQFQDKQAQQREMEEASAASFQGYGWSRADSNASTKRKVTLHFNDDSHSNKMQKRLNRFGDPVGFRAVTRGSTDKVSLEETIGRKNTNGAETQSFNRMAAGKFTPTGRPTSMFGNERSLNFNTGRTVPRENVHKIHGFGNNMSRGCSINPAQFYNGQRNQTPHYCQPPNQNFRPGYSFNKNLNKYQFRPVVIDGSNVAFTYGEDLHFACEGIRVCVDYFVKLGCDDVTVVVPTDRLKRGASKDVHILHELKKRNMVVANWNGQFASSGHNREDKLFILELAFSKGGIIVSNLSFTNDIARFHPGQRRHIWNTLDQMLRIIKVMNFRFTSATPKEIIFPDVDESGMYGPTWEDIFR